MTSKRKNTNKKPSVASSSSQPIDQASSSSAACHLTLAFGKKKKPETLLLDDLKLAAADDQIFFQHLSVRLATDIAKILRFSSTVTLVTVKPYYDYLISEKRQTDIKDHCLFYNLMLNRIVEYGKIAALIKILEKIKLETTSQELLTLITRMLTQLNSLYLYLLSHTSSQLIHLELSRISLDDLQICINLMQDEWQDVWKICRLPSFQRHSIAVKTKMVAFIQKIPERYKTNEMVIAFVNLFELESKVLNHLISSDRQYILQLPVLQPTIPTALKQLDSIAEANFQGKTTTFKIWSDNLFPPTLLRKNRWEMTEETQEYCLLALELLEILHTLAHQTYEESKALLDGGLMLKISSLKRRFFARHDLTIEPEILDILANRIVKVLENFKNQIISNLSSLLKTYPNLRERLAKHIELINDVSAIVHHNQNLENLQNIFNQLYSQSTLLLTQPTIPEEEHEANTAEFMEELDAQEAVEKARIAQLPKQPGRLESCLNGDFGTPQEEDPLADEAELKQYENESKIKKIDFLIIKAQKNSAVNLKQSIKSMETAISLANEIDDVNLVHELSCYQCRYLYMQIQQKYLAITQKQPKFKAEELLQSLYFLLLETPEIEIEDSSFRKYQEALPSATFILEEILLRKNNISERIQTLDTYFSLIKNRFQQIKMIIRLHEEVSLLHTHVEALDNIFLTIAELPVSLGNERINSIRTAFNTLKSDIVKNLRHTLHLLEINKIEYYWRKDLKEAILASSIPSEEYSKIKIKWDPPTYKPTALPFENYKLSVARLSSFCNVAAEEESFPTFTRDDSLFLSRSQPIEKKPSVAASSSRRDEPVNPVPTSPQQEASRSLPPPTKMSKILNNLHSLFKFAIQESQSLVLHQSSIDTELSRQLRSLNERNQNQFISRSNAETVEISHPALTQLCFALFDQKLENADTQVFITGGAVLRILTNPVLADNLEFDYLTSLSLQQTCDRLKNYFQDSSGLYVETHINNLAKFRVPVTDRRTYDDIMCHDHHIHLEEEIENRDLTRSAVFLELIEIHPTTGVCVFTIHAPIPSSINDIITNKICYAGNLAEKINTPQRIRRLLKAILQNAELDMHIDNYLKDNGVAIFLGRDKELAKQQIKQLIKGLHFETNCAIRSITKYTDQTIASISPELAQQKIMVAKNELAWLLPQGIDINDDTITRSKIIELVNKKLLDLLQLYSFINLNEANRIKLSCEPKEKFIPILQNLICRPQSSAQHRAHSFFTEHSGRPSSSSLVTPK